MVIKHLLGILDTWQSPPSSVAACPWRKLTNKCWTSKTRTPLTSLNGFPTMLRLLYATFLHVVWRWLPPSLVTLPPSKNCSSVSQNNSLLCSEERLSCIGTLAKAWTKWNSLKPKATWTVWKDSYGFIR